jgi:alkylation response protein AidB-like acyl-CoA dehydrogenase
METSSPFFTPTENEEALIAVAREFASEVLGPAEHSVDTESQPAKAYTSPEYKYAMAESYRLGLHKMTLPESCGGLGIRPTVHREILEILAGEAPGLAATLVVTPLAALLIALFGLEKRHKFYKDYLEAFVEDKNGTHSSCWAVTEPQLGSDLMNTESPAPPAFQTKARWNRAQGNYVIDGTKSAFVSNAWRADSILLMLRVDGPDSSGPGAFLVPADLPGTVKGMPIDKLGLRALNQAEIAFNDVEVPPEFLLIPPSEERFSFTGRLIVTAGNTSVGTLAVAVASSAYRQALAYAQQRLQGGKPIIQHQLIRMKFFEAQRDLEAARLMLQKSAWLIERGTPDLALAFSARHLACTVGLDICANMVQVLGGYGICKEYGVEKAYRDIKLLQIMDGTLERVALTAAASLYDGPAVVAVPQHR